MYCVSEVCGNFAAAGWCRFDDRCKFLRMYSE